MFALAIVYWFHVYFCQALFSLGLVSFFSIKTK